MFLTFFLIFKGKSYLQEKETEKDTYFKSVYSSNGINEEIKYSPMLIERVYNAFPRLHSSILEAEYVLVDIPEPESNIRDKHYEDYDHLNFHANSYLKINPPMISNAVIKSYKQNNFSVSIINTDPKLSVQIQRVYSRSPTIFIAHANGKEIGPGKKFTFTFSILYNKIGQYSDIIYIDTNNGTIPYYVNYNVEPRALPTIKPTTVYHTINRSERISFSFDLGIDNRACVYDSSIFASDLSSLSNFFLNLQPLPDLSPGIYNTFIYIYEYNTEFVVPIILHIVGENEIIPTQKQIYLPTLYQAGAVYKDIELYNSLNHSIAVQNCSFDNENDSMFSYVIDTTRILPHTKGKGLTVYFSMTNTPEQTIKNDIKLYIQCMDLEEKTNYTLTVTVYASFVISDVHLDVCSDFDTMYNDQTSIGCFQVKNTNKDPLVVLGVSASTGYFQINEFEPVILQPNEFSRNFFLSLSKDYDLLHLSSSIIIQTNASTILAEIKKFTRNIHIDFDDLNATYDKKTPLFTVGNVYGGSRKNFTAIITNRNMLPYNLKSIESSTNLTVFSPDLINPIYVPPLETVELKVIVEFKESNQNKEFTDLINFIGDEGNVNVKITYTTIPGSLNIITNIKTSQTFGTKEEGEIRVLSTFEGNIPFYGLTMNLQNYQPVGIPGYITKDIELIVANAAIDFSSSNKITKDFFDVINANESYSAQVDAWDLLWKEPIKSSIIVNLIIDDGFYFVKKIDYHITCSTFPRISIEFSTIHADEIFCKSAVILNYFNSPVKFTFHSTKQSTKFTIKHRKSIVVMPHETFDFLVTFEGLEAGTYFIEIPVTTNATPPFVIPVSATVEYPKIRFSDINKNMVTHLDFTGGEDEMYMYEKWTKCVYVTNNALTPISMKNLQITPNTFLKFRANNTNLQPYQTCSICFDFSLWLYENEPQNQEIQFSVLAQRLFYNLPIYINISDVALKHIYHSVDQTMNIISIIGLAAPIISIGIAIVCYFWFRKELKWRMKRVDRAVKHYSVNNYQNIEVQKDEDFGVCRTQWVYRRRRSTMKATDHTIDIMEQLIR